MAIYDNDGAVNREMGAIYDNDGTTNYQIGKVYDNNGTTNSLIYSAGLDIYKNGTYASVTGGFTKTYAQNSGNYNITSTHLKIFADLVHPYGGNTWVRTVNPINLTNYKKLIFTAYRSGGDSSATTTVGFDTNTQLNELWRDATYKTAVTSTSETTYTLDVSSLSGNYYLWFVCMAPKTTPDYYLYVNNVVLEE